jgi:hypothetical protein
MIQSLTRIFNYQPPKEREREARRLSVSKKRQKKRERDAAGSKMAKKGEGG